MPHNYAVRVTVPYNEFEKVVCSWALRCDKMVVYEHIGDQTEKPHVHVLMFNSAVVDTLKEDIRKCINKPMKGNRDWSFKTKYKDKKTKQTYNVELETEQRFITYMSKGKFEPKYVKGYTNEYINECKSKWVNYVKDTAKNKSSWQVEFENFVEYIEVTWSKEEWNSELEPTLHKTSFERLKSHVWKYVMEQECVWSPRAAQIYKSITLTYAYKYNISFDEKLLWK